MQPRLRSVIVAGGVALAGLLGTGARDAKAQLFVGTPGFALGVGTPVVPAYPAYGAFPGYGIYPGYPVGYGAFPVRPYPYGYGRPGFYGPRPYGYHRYGYRRW